MRLRNFIKWSSLLSFGFVAFARSEPVLVTPVLDKAVYAPGDSIILALDIKIESQFHLYSNPLGPGIGIPLEIQVTNGGQSRWSSLRKTKPIKFIPDYGDWVWAYEKEAAFFVVGQVSESAQGDQTVEVAMNGLTCSTACMPFNQTISVSIPIQKSGSTAPSFEKNPRLAKWLLSSEEMPFGAGEAEPTLSDAPVTEESETTQIPDWDYMPQEKKREFNIALALLFAFIAGMILNVMPCVLPVLGIKILSFSQGREGSRRAALSHSLVFAAGMLLVFMLLATLAAFAGFSWGEQFQTPGFLVAIITIIFVFALGMFDVFQILVPTQIATMGAQAGVKHGYGDDFVKGMFATILATPCSGPLLGATLAWTLTQSALIVYLVFAALGLGMASPYVVLAMSKRLSKVIPKPGAWMSDFKHFMGFLLFGFSVYLMIGLPKDMVVSTVGLCLSLAFAIVVYGRIAPFGSAWRRKILSGLVALAIALAGWYLTFEVLYNSVSDKALEKSTAEAADWQPFSPEKLLAAQEAGQNVMVDFTANWCMNCQFNKITVLYSPEISRLIEAKKIVPLKADLTTANPDAELLMHHLGSRSVPFLTIFNKQDPQRPIIMRDLLNKKRLAETLQALPD